MAETDAGSTEVAPVEGAEQTEIQTSPGTPEESSTAAALTPEQRDAATFARHGLNPDGTALTKATEPTPSVEAPKPTEKVADPADENEAGDDEDDEDGDTGEITDERITATVEAALELNAELVSKNPKLRAIIEAEIRESIDAGLAAERAATTASQQREQLIGQGKAAVDSITTLLDSAQAELTKAKNGDDSVNWDILAKASENVGQLLGRFGSAAVVDTQRGYEQAFTRGFLVAQKIGGPLTEEEQAAVGAIVNSANRMEADVAQGDKRFDLAKQHFYEKTLELLTTRAKTAGKAEAIAEAKAKRESRKTVLDADAVIAGAAKEAAKRVTLPPAPTAAGPSSTIVAPNLESYKAAKNAGNYDLADEIMRAMEQSVPATTRR